MKSVMFIEAQKLIGLPVAAEDTNSKIGQIHQILIDPENGRVLGFEITPTGILPPTKVLSITDIVDWDPNGLVTHSIDNIVDKNEILRIKEIIDKNIYLIGKGCQTESGKNLGKAEDLLIDTETESVTKYYINDLFGQARVFTADKVVKIDKKIIFRDDVAEAPTGAAGAESVTA